MQPSVARLIDANANRAREAFRVLEDIARFALDDEDLARDLKNARHELVADLSQLDPGLLLASRDTPNDVGRAISTDREAKRAGPSDIAAAAAARLTEALRSIEEATKSLPPHSTRRDIRAEPGLGEGQAEHTSSPSPLPARIESIRYHIYDIEKRLRLALGPGLAPQWRLCVLITESLCAHQPWERVAELALEGGADCLQLREKNLPDHELLERARTLVAIARNANAHAVINDRPDVALLAGAHGVHLGRHDMTIPDARRLAGFSLFMGASTENLDQARQAHRAGADTIALGPMFPTTTKDKPRIAGPEYLRAYLAEPTLAARPHLAIGGITPDNVRQLAEAGCRGVAVSSAVCAAPDPAEACRSILS